MRYTKICLFLLLLQLYAVFVPMSVLGYKTHHVAIIPLVNTAHIKDPEVLQLIDTKVRNKFRFPFYEIIPAETTAAAIKKTAGPTEKITGKEAMKKISTSLSADIIIAIELVQGKSDIINSANFFDDDTYVYTDVRLKCYTYSAADDSYLSLTAFESGREPLTIDTGVYQSVERLMDQLTNKLPYKRVPNDAINQGD